MHEAIQVILSNNLREWNLLLSCDRNVGLAQADSTTSGDWDPERYS
jgi:hypothetical protein